MEYLVVFDKSEDGSIWATVPDLEGCYSVGDTVDEVREHMKEAIELYIEDLKADRKTIPSPIPMKGEMVEVVAL